MGKYKNKPIIIDAYQWSKAVSGTDVKLLDKPHKVGEFIFEGEITINDNEEKYTYFVSDSDWIITDHNGNKYVIKDSVFKDTYEEVVDGET
jgi:uncharacterized protein affecting Mg2+/Co2+ transport